MKNKVTIMVPATSANCGPGYDIMGLACNLYNEFTYELTEEGVLSLDVSGEGAELLKADSDNLAFVSFYKLWNDVMPHKKVGLKVRMLNRIPLSRGMGSSSTAIVAGLMAANELSEAGLSKECLVEYATEIEGHPDNVAPALLGGFTISYMKGAKVSSFRFVPAKELRYVAVVPSEPLSTRVARQAVPKTINHADGVFNSGRSALLVASLLSGDYSYLADAMEDKLHQPYRLPLIKGADDVLVSAVKAGAYGAIISGAGSTLIAYVDPSKDCEAIGQTMVKAFEEAGQKAVYHVLELDKKGAYSVDN